MDGVRVSRSVVIPLSELDIRFSPSGGPGGQHANRSSTRVELSWNPGESTVLGPVQKARVLERLGNRLDGSGNLRLVSDERRSQLMNRETALERLAALVGDALIPPKPRKPTKPSRSAKEKRIQSKRRRSEVKRDRRKPDQSGD
jgi:ribosome-associated protein